MSSKANHINTSEAFQILWLVRLIIPLRLKFRQLLLA